jgi:hypothetical protein
LQRVLFSARNPEKNCPSALPASAAMRNKMRSSIGVGDALAKTCSAGRTEGAAVATEIMTIGPWATGTSDLNPRAVMGIGMLLAPWWILQGTIIGAWGRTGGFLRACRPKGTRRSDSDASPRTHGPSPADRMPGMCPAECGVGVQPPTPHLAHTTLGWGCSPQGCGRVAGYQARTCYWRVSGAHLLLEGIRHARTLPPTRYAV